MQDSKDERVRALFEVPDFALCLALQQRLQNGWDARVVGRSESRFVAVEADPLQGGTEPLVQAVAEWAAEVGLSQVRFHIGERMHTVMASSADDGS